MYKLHFDGLLNLVSILKYDDDGQPVLVASREANSVNVKLLEEIVNLANLGVKANES